MIYLFILANFTNMHYAGYAQDSEDFKDSKDVRECYECEDSNLSNFFFAGLIEKISFLSLRDSILSSGFFCWFQHERREFFGKGFVGEMSYCFSVLSIFES